MIKVWVLLNPNSCHPDKLTHIAMHEKHEDQESVEFVDKASYDALQSDLVVSNINLQAHNNLLRDLHTANERIVEFEGYKKQHLEYVKKLKRTLCNYCSHDNCETCEPNSEFNLKEK